MIKLPTLPEKPSFTSRKLTRMADLRDAIKGWVEMFQEPILPSTEVSHQQSSPINQPTDEDKHSRRRSQMGIGDGFNTSSPPAAPSSPNLVPSSPTIGDEEEEEEGPYEEDTLALSTYLTRVVKEEHDIAKSVDLVRWLQWCVDELIANPVLSGMGNEDEKEKEFEARKDLRQRWNNVLKRIKDDVQEAAKSRGVKGELDFG